MKKDVMNGIIKNGVTQQQAEPNIASFGWQEQTMFQHIFNILFEIKLIWW